MAGEMKRQSSFAKGTRERERNTEESEKKFLDRSLYLDLSELISSFVGHDSSSIQVL